MKFARGQLCPYIPKRMTEGVPHEKIRNLNEVTEGGLGSAALFMSAIMHFQLAANTHKNPR
jgi:hypothetical protein